MPSLTTVLFPAPALRRGPLELFRWWESRRLTFNVAVGGAGLVTLGAFELLVRVPLHQTMPVPLLGVAAYGALANVCYSFGWIAESALQRWLGRETYGLGPALWRYGLVYSVGLTLTPIAVFAIGFVARLLGAA